MKRLQTLDVTYTKTPYIMKQTQCMAFGWVSKCLANFGRMFIILVSEFSSVSVIRNDSVRRPQVLSKLNQFKLHVIDVYVYFVAVSSHNESRALFLFARNRLVYIFRLNKFEYISIGFIDKGVLVFHAGHDTYQIDDKLHCWQKSSISKMLDKRMENVHIFMLIVHIQIV